MVIDLVWEELETSTMIMTNWEGQYHDNDKLRGTAP